MIFLRLIKILIAYDLDRYLVRTRIGKILFRALKHLPIKKQGEGLPFGARLRLALQEMGPVWIKLGQSLSTRTRQLPLEIVTELAKLRDECEPFDRYFADRAVRRAAKVGKIADAYKYFSFHPAAAGSIAQVHYAVLHTGEQVAVKVLRPKVREAVERDMRDFTILIKILSGLDSRIKALDLDSILDELKRAFTAELDLEIEAVNIHTFEKFITAHGVRVPKVYAQFSSPDVLVMEWMRGIHVDDLEGMKRQQIDPVKVAEHGLELFMLQVFKYGTFHADPHSGNIWLDESGNRIFLDFGLIGVLSKLDKTSLAKLMVFSFTAPKKIVTVLKERNWIGANTKEDKLALDLEGISKHVAGVKLNKVSVNVVLNEMLNICQEHGCKLPSQYTLLVKTLATLEGNTYKLAPQFNAKTIGEKIIEQHFMGWFK
jgi:ubiquinone biosynthesis protein